MTQSKVLWFDWKENPNAVIEDFADALKEFGISVFEIETHSDSFAVVIGDNSMTKDDAKAIYERQEEAE